MRIDIENFHVTFRDIGDGEQDTDIALEVSQELGHIVNGLYYGQGCVSQPVKEVTGDGFQRIWCG